MKKLKALRALTHDDNGKMHPLKSKTDEKGNVTYYMERPQPSKPLNKDACTFHVYEMQIGFTHDLAICKFCGHEQWRGE